LQRKRVSEIDQERERQRKRERGGKTERRGARKSEGAARKTSWNNKGVEPGNQEGPGC